ncbi:MAG TPA: FG-GAP-like repeat-containing protein [Candidatus Eisenbacteria bacterium]|jgi:type II secretory pathway pseudopilin PulG
MLELLVTLGVLVVISIALTAVLMTTMRGKNSTSNFIESTQAARAALEMIASDVRTAGYGADADTTPAQLAVAYVDSMEMILNENLQPYPDPHLPPFAYNPAGTPRPFKLDNTAWQPSIKYRTGAEIVRYTLDASNDGLVNSTDAAGTAASRTRNPDDFALLRQVYGDSVNNVAGNNGPFLNEEVALVRKPGGTVAPLFTVYLRGSSTPWNWSDGPIPTTQLKNVDRVVVKVTAPSGKADYRGKYAETVLTTEVNAARNAPNWGLTTYPVDGYVFDDANQDHTKQPLELGIAGVGVRLGNSYTAVTGTTGHFIIRAPAGTYTLQHTPLANYGNFNNPATYSVTVPPSASRDFADTARAGGFASVTAFRDLNDNLYQDAGEPGRSSVAIRLDPAGTTSYTDGYGNASIFVQSGGYTLTCTPPDSFVVTSPNPVSGTMTNGGSASHSFALKVSATGITKGKVFRDNNRDGAYQGTEPGLQNVWVGVTTNGGVTVQGYTYTDASGDYAITVPVNDPPHTAAYSIIVAVPNGYFPTTSTSISPVWLTNGQVASNQNFGLVAYQIITLNASRVLSLGSRDLMEKDWSGGQTDHAHGDADIVLGADAGGTDNISVWFSQYDATPLFSPSPVDPTGYTRNAANSVLSLVVDTLDANVSPFARPDIATGTLYATAGNLFVWYNQNSSGNQGYVKTTPDKSYKTADNGDVQAVKSYDCAGGAKPDLLAGTKSATAGHGTIEVWQSDDGATPNFGRVEIYPPAGSIPGSNLGEVTSMALADLNGDGKRDLVVGTKTGTYNGQIAVFRFVTKITGARFTCAAVYTLPTSVVTSVTCLDVNGDGYLDIVAGTQTGTATGQIQYWKNDNAGTVPSFTSTRTVDAPGIVTSLAAADLGGGASRTDVAMGWRATDTGYGGGILVYYCDSGTFPSNGTDPSAGSVFNFVPALTVNNFNYGVYPVSPAPPFLTDLAAGVKASPTTGALVVFIR